ncbi:2OG-Fe(II) oxygenase [Flavobacterium sp. 7A]|uniref:2OG-Fe(II) oxygenase n=1 Tax=Flavobacterium sp. 7A TaxID=2940571 RepID=UPI002227E0F4|nr:2OG-Fe(II) oxygenase [Flavobacterium sp. 7A]
MQDQFEYLIDKYINDDFGVCDNFLETSLAFQLKLNLQRLTASQALRTAGISNNIAVLNKSVRSDVIYWLDRSHNNVFENAFLDTMDAFVAYLNQQCFAGIISHEFHYALYKPGTFYSKHKDQFINSDSRQFSMIIYLNENWKIGDGGELCIYMNDIPQNISPDFGKAVFFKSCDLFHEVLETNVPRMSITGWLKR